MLQFQSDHGQETNQLSSFCSDIKEKTSEEGKGQKKRNLKKNHSKTGPSESTK